MILSFSRRSGCATGIGQCLPRAAHRCLEAGSQGGRFPGDKSTYIDENNRNTLRRWNKMYKSPVKKQGCVCFFHCHVGFSEGVVWRFVFGVQSSVRHSPGNWSMHFQISFCYMTKHLMSQTLGLVVLF